MRRLFDRPPLRAAALLLAVAAAAFGAGAPIAAPQSGDAGPTEWDVKAAFLFNFAKYVEWPAEALPADGTFTICVLGPDPFGRALEETLEGKSVLGRRIVIRRTTRLEDVERAQIVYVGAEQELSRVAAALAGTPVLVVADGEGLAERGAIIAFRTRQRRVRFEINLEKAEASRLKLSSQLLKLARLVPAGAPG